MATKAKTKTKTYVRAKEEVVEYRRFMIPALIGGAIAWVFSGSLELGALIFVAVFVGNWIGESYYKKQ
mgnify:CR=1 FL=1